MELETNLSWKELFTISQVVVGVPDSMLSGFAREIPNTNNHIIAPNEGSAIAFAAGYSLATREVPIVYMQNSGLGNAVNPLLSLAHRDIYGCPMVLLVGWRGETGVLGAQNDEPQHNPTGRVSQSLIELVTSAATISDSDNPLTPNLIREVMETARGQSSPSAILVRSSGLLEFKQGLTGNRKYQKGLPSRREYLEQLSRIPDAFFVATTGHISREMKEVCDKREIGDRLFMVTGAMGHVISVACGFAASAPSKHFIILDGDGSLQMHMGSAALLSRFSNVSYVVLNNGAHGSVGGQPTASPQLNLSKLLATFTETPVARVASLDALNRETGSRQFFIECMTDLTITPNLSRPTVSHKQMSQEFVSKLGAVDEQ